jgi:hypothetical protein
MGANATRPASGGEGADYAGLMALARLTGGPLDGQVIPLEDDVDDSMIVPYGEGQLVYQRSGEFEHTGDADGPSEAVFAYVEATQDINPNDDGRDD